MENLTDYNLRRQNEYIDRLFKKKSTPNGIACPECGEELHDHGNEVLTSIPPRRNVNCPSCGFMSSRIA